MLNDPNASLAIPASSSGIQKVVDKLKKDVLVYGPAIFIPAFIGMLNIVLFTRLFSPSEYGHYALILSTILFISTLVTQWIQQSIQRFRPEYREQSNFNEFDRSLMALMTLMLIGVLSFTLGAPFSQKFFGIKPSLYITLIVIIATQMLFVLTSTLLQSDYRALEYRRFNLINAILKAGLSLALIYGVSKSTDNIFLGLVIAQIVILLPMMKSIGYRLHIKPDFSLKTRIFIRRFISYGFPMIGWFIGNSLLNLLDRYMLGFYHSAQAVGVYTATYSVVAASIGLICTPLLTAAHPIIMNSSTKSGDREIERMISVFSKVYIMAILPIFACLSLLRNDVTALLLGEEFQAGSSILPLLMLGLIMWNFGMYGHKGFEIKNKTRSMLVFVLFCVFVNVGLNFLLIPSYSYFGAALASVISLSLYPTLVFIFSYRTIKWRIDVKSLFRIVCAVAVALGLTLITDAINFNVLFLGLAIKGMIFMIVYLSALVLLKEIKVPEKYRLRRAVK